MRTFWWVFKDLIIGKYVKNTFTCAFWHANALFSDTAGKIWLELMSQPNHSKGLFFPWISGWYSDNCQQLPQNVTKSCLLPKWNTRIAILRIVQLENISSAGYCCSKAMQDSTSFWLDIGYIRAMLYTTGIEYILCRLSYVPVESTAWMCIAVTRDQFPGLWDSHDILELWCSEWRLLWVTQELDWSMML